MEASASLPAIRPGAATPALADQWEADALAAIEAVDDPAAAEELLARIKLAAQAIRISRLGADREQRWGRVRLLGERRYGELLPAEAPGHRSDLEPLSVGKRLSEADHMARYKARQVAAVPAPAFSEYVDSAEQPTRAGLLREAGKMDVHFSSATDEWATPQDFFDVVAAEFSFELDVCALPSSAKCVRYFSPDDDGLAQGWSGTCWMNPPYGQTIGEWVQKARESAANGATVVCLLPARTDTAWWHDNCADAEVRFLRGRLRFGEAEASAPFPSALVIFGRDPRTMYWKWR